MDYAVGRRSPHAQELSSTGAVLRPAVALSHTFRKIVRKIHGRCENGFLENPLENKARCRLSELANTASDYIFASLMLNYHGRGDDM